MKSGAKLTRLAQRKLNSTFDSKVKMARKLTKANGLSTLGKKRERFCAGKTAKKTAQQEKLKRMDKFKRQAAHATTDKVIFSEKKPAEIIVAQDGGKVFVSKKAVKVPEATRSVMFGDALPFLRAASISDLEELAGVEPSPLVTQSSGAAFGSDEAAAERKHMRELQSIIKRQVPKSGVCPVNVAVWLHTAWMPEEDSLGAMLYNWTDEAAGVDLRLAGREVALNEGVDSPRVLRLEGVKRAVEASGRPVCELKLEGGGAATLVYEKSYAGGKRLSGVLRKETESEGISISARRHGR